MRVCVEVILFLIPNFILMKTMHFKSGPPLGTILLLSISLQSLDSIEMQWKISQNPNDSTQPHVLFRILSS